MSGPLTWQAVSHVANWMGHIAIADGYYTDAGALVSKEPSMLDPDVDVLALHVLMDGDALATGSQASHKSRVCPIVAEGYVVASQQDAHEKAHELLADMLRTVPQGKQLKAQMPAGMYLAEITGARVLIRPEGMPYVVAQVSLSIGMSSPTI